ncbi:hypothetical protein EYF80_041146 [Liparis tanakae]|uniref:Uncharacterized protein n=1 Tax=Liparis tanakae TaxID=230148 RepID=A0A4Z2G6V3_9TELE|nr:hypothetical protein EYF80_041146 [Liparis tanakae]
MASWLRGVVGSWRCGVVAAEDARRCGGPFSSASGRRAPLCAVINHAVTPAPLWAPPATAAA